MVLPESMGLGVGYITVVGTEVLHFHLRYPSMTSLVHLSLIGEDRSDRSSVGSFWSDVEDLRHPCAKG